MVEGDPPVTPPTSPGEPPTSTAKPGPNADAEQPSTAREEILARIRRALADVPRDVPRAEAEQVPREYLREHGARTEAENIELLAENLADYRAQVHRSSEADLPATIARLLAEHGSTSVAVPEALPDSWLSGLGPEVELVPDSAELTARRLDEVRAVISGCAIAIAETGTIILDAGPGQGRRMLTLVPDHHICVVRVPEQVVASVPQALERAELSSNRPQTWIAGPSATSDIELDRVEGVHGPRKLDVVLLGSPVRT
jgi:L-lactate dehydrogenase complex protein LldG